MSLCQCDIIIQQQRGCLILSHTLQKEVPNQYPCMCLNTDYKKNKSSSRSLSHRTNDRLSVAAIKGFAIKGKWGTMFCNAFQLNH